MKKLYAFILLLLIGCQSQPTPPAPKPQPPPPPMPWALKAAQAIRAPKLLKLEATSPATPYVLQVSWNYDFASNPNVGGFNLYQGTASGSYSSKFSLGPVLGTTVSNLNVNTTYYFAMTAVSTNNVESEYSPEASYTVPWNILTIRSQIWVTDMLNSGNWKLLSDQPVWSVTNPVANLYFRSSMSITSTNPISSVLKLDASTLVITNQ